ncbi:putative CRIB domain-containing protein RIC1 [Helianthus annuus]|nr:putative CRIB domain-containing protein RIC1 [Helianthus annuus]
MGSKDPLLIQTIIPLKMNVHKVKGLLKGLRYISQVFEEEKKQEIQIGGPTDVKHVAHFGCDGQAQESPSWMKGFGTPAASSNGSEASSQDGPDWVSEDAGQKTSRRERRHRRHRSVENAPDPDSQTKSRQPRRHHTRGVEGRRAENESLPELPKRNRRKKPQDDVNSQASARSDAEK